MTGGAGSRIRGLVRKEFLQVRRDASSFAIAFVLPAVLLFLFGFGVSLDAREVPVAVVVEDPTPEASDFVASLINSKYFVPRIMHARPPAERAMLAGEIDAIVVLRETFAGELNASDIRPAPIQAIVDGTNANRGRVLLGYLRGAWANWLAQRGLEDPALARATIDVEQRVWYNPAVDSRNFIVPGLVAIIMTLIGALLTALVVAREWERGTMEALFATPVRTSEILLGKLIPYFTLGMGGMALSVAMAVFVFEVPLRGSLLVLTAASAVFMVTALGMGLVISSVTRNQFVAAQTAILLTMLPAIMLSGFIFDIEAMPAWVQAVTYIVPARYFVAILQTLFLAGNIWPLIWPNLLALALFGTGLLLIAGRRTRKSLE
ncbi:ABC transporter permease [Ferruginivarius sediminum]|uniref:ABC transporter permease n=1 Tax=Ferruginivarius sediminum TaxID=2661937 RepID=A0A369T857_9PROT|nr:ABC transporter permease [Ferruginivarius sediminum]RDD61490.1 ABC transporter permease [Ferruginivarius sediminum]